MRERAAALGLDWSAGRVHMLGQWRTFGVLFNPWCCISIFPPAPSVRTRPWRRCATPLAGASFLPLRLREEGGEQVVEHDKTFHVSPFLPLALRYHWTLHALFPELRLTLRDQDGAETVFAAGLKLAMVEPGRRPWAR